jgi:methylated-DNA-[protein]-cysteine S-methyltransferase
LALTGTSFQQKVWQAIQKIAPGKTKTYGQLAKQLASAPRAIGQACKSNPIVIIVPCHRVVAANDIGGYAGARDGARVETKKWLLNHENNFSKV